MLVAKRSCPEGSYMSVEYHYSMENSAVLARLPQPVGILLDHYLAPHSVTLFQWMFWTLLPMAISS